MLVNLYRFTGVSFFQRVGGFMEGTKRVSPLHPHPHPFVRKVTFVPLYNVRSRTFSETVTERVDVYHIPPKLVSATWMLRVDTWSYKRLRPVVVVGPKVVPKTYSNRVVRRNVIRTLGP